MFFRNAGKNEIKLLGNSAIFDAAQVKCKIVKLWKWIYG